MLMNVNGSDMRVREGRTGRQVNRGHTLRELQAEDDVERDKVGFVNRLVEDAFNEQLKHL